MFLYFNLKQKTIFQSVLAKYGFHPENNFGGKYDMKKSEIFEIFCYVIKCVLLRRKYRKTLIF